MESIYNLEAQNSNLDYKIVSGLERISQVFKTLLLEKSKELNLSPIQIQLLIFIRYHSEDKATVSYLSQEFNLSKPTISETVKILEQKKYITKIEDKTDTRSYRIQVTELGKNIVSQTESFITPLTEIVTDTNLDEKLVIWKSITEIISRLNDLKIISVQRNCLNCRHYLNNGTHSFCNLLNQHLSPENMRIDCMEFEHQ